MPINNGVGRIGIRSYVAVSQQITTSTLLNSLYSVWNGDLQSTELDKSLYGVWNVDGTNNLTVKNAWNANGNANDSKGTANGTIASPSGTSFVVGTMSFGTGKLGSGAFTLNGSNFISLPGGTLNFTGDFSVSFWIYVPTAFGTNYSRILNAFDNSDGWNTYRGWDTTYNNGAMSFTIYNGIGTDYYSISVPMALKDQWVHVSVTKVLGQQGNIYINGVAGVKTVAQRGSGASSNIISYKGSNHLAYIGSDYYAFSHPYYTPTPAGGFKIDAVQTWDVILNQSAITELYNSGNGQEYPFVLSNAAIGTSKDSFGTNHGTLVNGTTFTTGIIGQAFSFDGVNDYINIGTNAGNFGSNSFAISTWFYPNVGNVLQVLVAKGTTSASDKGFFITIDNRYNSNQRGIQFGIVGNNSNYQAVATTNQYTIGAWNHVVSVWNSYNKTMNVYLNGVQATTTISQTGGSGASGIVDISNTGVNMLLGQYGNNSLNFNGKLDQLNIWDRVISNDEVIQLYNAGTGAQYPFSSQTLPSTMNQLGIDNATLMNGCTFGDGKIGKAFTFDGVNDYVQLPNNSLNLTTFSISAWVNPSNTVGSRTILNSANYVSALDYGWKFRIIDGQLSLQIFSTGGLINEYKGGGISTNTWTHVSATRINGSTKLYINGSLVGSQTSGSINNNPNFTTTTYCSIGSLTSAVSPISFFIGSIDSINVWQKELTQAEVTELYNSGNGKQITATPIVTNGLVLNLDAGRKSSYPNTGTIWTDISGNGNNGTMTNGPIFGTASGGQITFDGVNDYVELGTNTSLNLINISISVWVKPTTTTDYIPVIGRYHNTTTYNGWELYYFKSTNKFYFGGRESSSSYLQVMSNNTYSINNWYNITGVKLGNVWSLYVNGVLDNSLTLGSGTIAFGTNSIQIGGLITSGASYYGKSDISQSIIYNRALSQSEITQNFNATKFRFGL
jgi:hypothetical protein